jgi:aspartate/methionine/tyrosine aminotransferase
VGHPAPSPLPESLGLETRCYRLRRENGFRIGLDEINRLADSKTKVILVNSQHNPTDATIGDDEMEALHDFTPSAELLILNLHFVVSVLYFAINNSSPRPHKPYT